MAGQERTALLVEDDQSLLTVMPRVLGKIGFKTETIDSNGKTIAVVIAAIRQALSEHVISLIVLDGQYTDGTATDILSDLGDVIEGIPTAVFSGSRDVIEAVRERFPRVVSAEKPVTDAKDRLKAMTNQDPSPVA